MTKEEYIKTINVNGTKVNIGLDDYGQCYFFEFEKDGETKEVGCGTYNSFYMDEVYSYFGLDKFDCLVKDLNKFITELTPTASDYTDASSSEWAKFKAREEVAKELKNILDNY